MHPAFSILFFTSLIGIGQGIVVTLAVWVLMGKSIAPSVLGIGLILATVLLVMGLAASFFHLGHKLRAWRAIAMWRTSWMSREVIVLPIFIAMVALWAALTVTQNTNASLKIVMPLLCLVGSFVLWYCTAMIYACLKFIQEWASRFTVVNFVLIGLASGLLFTTALAAIFNSQSMTGTLGLVTVVALVLALSVRLASIARNQKIKHRSDLQSATGIRSSKIVQKSMGMSAGSFNTREFFHGAKMSTVRHVRVIFVLMGFVVPALLGVVGLVTGDTWPWVLGVVAQVPGLVAERWHFFAQAQHPQNLYYGTVG
jgi:sulfite dehydrogenase (quinone) subunit SoeC